MNGNVKVVAVLTARSGQGGALRALLEGMIEPSRSEVGNLRYDLWADASVPDRFVLDELYTGHDAVEAHRATQHFQHYLAEVGSLAERSAWTLDEVVTR